MLVQDATGYICNWYTDRNEPDPSGSEPTDPDERAAWIAANHAGTPQVQHFDALGRLFLVVDDNDTETVETRYEFDINGLALTVTDALNRTMTTNMYNMLGKAIYTQNIDSGRRWSLTDVAGKPIYRWDNRHQQIENTYDTLQRPTSETLRLSASAFSKVQVMVYGTSTTNNLNGNLTELKDQSGKTTFTEYDFKGNLISSSKQFAQDYENTIDWDQTVNMETETFDTDFTYDAMNRPIVVTQPDDSEIAYGYNKAGLLETVKAKIRGDASESDFVTNINYNEKGQRTEIFYENGSKTASSYDDKSFRLTNLKTTRNSGNDILQDINYTYDAVGNITEFEDDAQQTFYFSNSVIEPKGKYWYDALYRLTKATGRELSSLAKPTHTDFVNNLAVPNTGSNAMQNFKQEYSYDKLGNINQMKSSVGTNWTRDYYYETANNRLKNHDNTTDVYDYDEHGNCIEMPHLPQLDWDYKDELKEVTLNTGGDKAYYIFNSTGERVRKVVDKGSVVEERLYIGGFEVYRKTVSGTLNYERETLKITEGRNTIAQLETKTIENGNTISTPTTNQRFQYSNHLGSACLELDSSANIITYEEYHPFGTTSYRSGSSETEVSQKQYKYVGKERDEETGLYYYGARYYAAWIARFVSVDPLQFKYPHYTPYQYAGNKPISYIDLDGLEEVDPQKEETKKSVYESSQRNGGIKVIHQENEFTSWSSEDQDEKIITTEGFEYDMSKEALDKFLETSTGQWFVNLFMKKGEVIGTYTAKYDGPLADSKLILRETNFDNVGNMAQTGISLQLKSKEGDYSISPFRKKNFKRDTKLKTLQSIKSFNIEITFHPKMFDKLSSDNSNAADLAQTLGHEAFLHATMSVFNVLLPQKNKDYEKVMDEISKEPDEGDFDHSNYINNIENVGTGLFNHFRKEFEKVVGKTLSNEIWNKHDKKYQHLKN